MFPGTTFSCAYFSASRQEKCVRSISEVIRCSRLALRSDLGSRKIKKKIDALSGQNAIFTVCLSTQGAEKSCSRYACQPSGYMQSRIYIYIYVCMYAEIYVQT